MTKAQEISRQILDRASQVAGRDGVSFREGIPEAIDFVCGAGTYERLVSDLYDDLRAKAAA